MVAGVVLVASFVAVFFFVGICYLVNNRITNLYELERIDVSPVIGSVPMSNHLNWHALHVLEKPRSMVSESLRTLRTNLDFFHVDAGKKTIEIGRAHV